MQESAFLKQKQKNDRICDQNRGESVDQYDHTVFFAGSCLGTSRADRPSVS